MSYRAQMGEYFDGAGDATRIALERGTDYAKKIPGAVLNNKYGRYGAAGLGAYLGGRYIAYPLLKGNIDAETRYGIAKSPIGSFLTGEDQNSPDLLDSVAAQAADEQQAKNRALLIEEQARAEQQYRDRARFDSRMSYDNTQDLMDLNLGGNRLQGQYDLTAGLLANATRNYAAAMNDNTNAIANLLGPRIQLR
jgi:hypothetical protein